MTQEVETKKHNISIREMPVDLWRAFRMYCLDHDKTVEDEVVNALNEYLVTRAKEETDRAAIQAPNRNDG